jgi:hypothetical protein
VLPLGAFVLIDQQGTDTLKEFGMVHEAICYLVLHLKRFFEVKVMTTLDLLEDDSHAEGAEAGNLFADFRSKLCFALLDSLIDVLNGICIEDAIDLLDVGNRIVERVEVRVIHHNVKDLLLGGFISHSRFKVPVKGFKLSLRNEMSGNAPLNKLSSLQSVTCQA